MFPSAIQISFFFVVVFFNGRCNDFKCQKIKKSVSIFICQLNFYFIVTVWLCYSIGFLNITLFFLSILK